jgi:hypothetical protein
MSTKSYLKLVVAFGLLAILLIFLGVNYVPRIFAASTIKENLTFSSIQTRPDYINELYPRAIVPQLSYAGSDWIDRHPSFYYTNSDWIERHP